MSRGFVTIRKDWIPAFAGMTEKYLFRLFTSSSSIEVVKNDPNDDRFIEAALDSGGSIIISGDEHLLGIKEYQGIMMLSPREFWKVYEKIQK